MKKKISIVIPILNEERNISVLCKKISKVLNNEIYEILFVDDNSEDNSKKILKKLSLKNKRINFIIRKHKIKDLTQSCFLGIEKSQYNNILIMDGDLQHDPEDILKLLKKYNSNYDIVIGTRKFNKINSKNFSNLRLFATKLLIIIFNFISKKNFTDPMSGFFIFKKEIYLKNKKKFYGKGFKILADILCNSKNLNYLEVNINFKKRSQSLSKMNIKVLFLLLIFIFRILIKKD